MSMPSLYSSGEDEEEIFRLTDPDEHPDSSDEDAARLEEASLSSSSYADDQDELDELAESIHLEVAFQELSDDERAEVVRLIEEIQGRREGDAKI